jgi:hypothetical protein
VYECHPPRYVPLPLPFTVLLRPLVPLVPRVSAVTQSVTQPLAIPPRDCAHRPLLVSVSSRRAMGAFSLQHGIKHFTNADGLPSDGSFSDRACKLKIGGWMRPEWQSFTIDALTKALQVSLDPLGWVVDFVSSDPASPATCTAIVTTPSEEDAYLAMMYLTPVASPILLFDTATSPIYNPSTASLFTINRSGVSPRFTSDAESDKYHSTRVLVMVPGDQDMLATIATTGMRTAERITFFHDWMAASSRHFHTALTSVILRSLEV